MAITSVNKNSNPVKYYASGKFLDTGTVKKSILNLGFKPSYFKLWDVSATELIFEVTDQMAATTGVKTGNDGALTLETSGLPSLIENFDSGAKDLWTVYEAPASSRLNKESERFSGVSIPAALIATSVQAHWVAFG